MTNSSTSTSIADRPMQGSDEGQQGPLGQTGQQAGESVGQIVERASDVGIQRVDQGREQVAHTLETLAQTIRKAASEVQSKEPTVAEMTSTAAEQTERIARFLRDTDARELLNRVEDGARRQPLLFLGGAFLAGLAASRFLKAASGTSSDGSRRSYADTGYGTDYRPGMSSEYRATGGGS